MDRLLPAIAAALTACVLAGFAAANVDGLWRPDAFDYAQIARELVSGNGFSTRQVIYLLHLEFLEQHGGLEGPWPTLHRFPLPSLAIALAYAVFGVGTTAVVATGIAFHALTSGLVFAWGRTAAGLPVACATSLLVTANAAMLETAPSGLAEAPTTFFFTLALYGLWRTRDDAGMRSAVLCGAALGLAALSRTNALFVAPIFALALLRSGPRGWKRVLWWGGSLLLVVSPWLVRNTLVAGSPLFSLHSYFLLPAGTHPDGWKWDVTLPWVHGFVPPLRFALDHPGAVLAKWLHNLGGFAHDLPTLADTLGLPLVALAGLLPPRRRGAGRERSRLRSDTLVLFACLVANALLVSFTDIYFDKYHYLYLPALTVLGATVVADASARLRSPRARAAAFAAAIVVMANPLRVAEAPSRVRAMQARYDRSQLAWIRDHTRPDDLVMSDFSYAVTWDTERRSIRTHYDRLADGSTILATGYVADRYLPVDAIYLSAEFTSGPGRSRTLRNSLERDARFQREYRIAHRFADGALFLVRDVRDES